MFNNLDKIKSLDDLVNLFCEIFPPLVNCKEMLNSQLLESFGYFPDKNKVKDKKGFLGEKDGFHIQIAAHSDFFVTNDNGSLNRAKAVISNCNSTCKVYKLNDFVEILNDKN